MPITKLLSAVGVSMALASTASAATYVVNAPSDLAFTGGSLTTPLGSVAFPGTPGISPLTGSGPGGTFDASYDGSSFSSFAGSFVTQGPLSLGSFAGLSATLNTLSFAPVTGSPWSLGTGGGGSVSATGSFTVDSFLPIPGVTVPFSSLAGTVLLTGPTAFTLTFADMASFPVLGSAGYEFNFAGNLNIAAVPEPAEWLLMLGGLGLLGLAIRRRRQQPVAGAMA